MGKDIFISHSSIDKDFAFHVAEDLKSRGVNVWLDAWDIPYGGNIAAEIDKGLKNSSFLLVILSEASLSSKWVEVEWTAKFGEEVRNESITVIPTILGEVSEEHIPLLLAGKRRVNLSENYEVELKSFVEFILNWRRDKFQSDLVQKLPENFFKEALTSGLENIDERVLNALSKKIALSSSMAPERRIALVTNELIFQHEEAKVEEKKQQDIYAGDPDGVELMKMLIFGRKEAVIRRIKEKIEFVVSSSGSAAEAVENIIFEIEFLKSDQKSD